MTENARSGRDGTMKMATVHKRIVLMTLQAELLRRVGPQHEAVIALMRIVTIRAFAFLHGLMDKVLHRHEVAGLAELLVHRG